MSRQPCRRHPHRTAAPASEPATSATGAGVSSISFAASFSLVSWTNRRGDCPGLGLEQIRLRQVARSIGDGAVGRIPTFRPAYRWQVMSPLLRAVAVVLVLVALTACGSGAKHHRPSTPSAAGFSAV